jgi:hypothetical protein
MQGMGQASAAKLTPLQNHASVQSLGQLHASTVADPSFEEQSSHARARAEGYAFGTADRSEIRVAFVRSVRFLELRFGISVSNVSFRGEAPYISVFSVVMTLM